MDTLQLWHVMAMAISYNWLYIYIYTYIYIYGIIHSMNGVLSSVIYRKYWQHLLRQTVSVERCSTYLRQSFIFGGG